MKKLFALVLLTSLFSCDESVKPNQNTGFIKFKINSQKKRFEGTPLYAIHTSSSRKLISFKATESNDPFSAIFSIGIEDPDEVKIGEYNSVFQGYAPPRPSVNAGFDDEKKGISYGTTYNDPAKAVFYTKVNYIDSQWIDGTFSGKFTNEKNLNVIVEVSYGKFEFRN